MFFPCLGALEFNKHEHAMCVFVIGRFDLSLEIFQLDLWFGILRCDLLLRNFL